MRKIFLMLLAMALPMISFAIEPGKWYTVQNSRLGVTVKNASAKAGDQLIVWNQTPVPSHVWQLIDDGDGLYSFQCGYSGIYMRYNTSVQKVITSLRHSSSASWVLEPVEGKTNTFHVLTPDMKYAMAVATATAGTGVTLLDPTTADASKIEWVLTEYTDEVSTEYDEHARDAIIDGFMTQYYHNASSGHVLGGGGVWGDAEMFETLLDAFETTGDTKYKTYWSELKTNFASRAGTDWTRTGQGWPRYNEYNDDITWLVLAYIRGYKYFKSRADLNVAKNNFDKMWTRAYQPGGTLRWSQNASDHGSNSCINCPAIIAACYLYEMTGEEDYLTKAKNLWDAQYNTLCDKNDGHVWDSGEWNSDFTQFTPGNYWGSTYNQGTMLGASVKLYQLTGDSKYKSYATKVYNWSYNNLTNSDKIVNACQTAVGDLCGFKGILMRYVRMYGEAFGKEDALKWLEKNAWFAYQNANSKGVIWSKWLTKTSEDFKSQEGNDVKDFKNDAFGASTAVSAAINAHVNRVFTKDAYSPIEMSMLDDIQFMQRSDTYDDGDTPVTTKGDTDSYICFKNVNFGSEGAVCASLRLNGTSTASIYIDKIDEEHLMATTEQQVTGWADYFVNLKEPVTGTHFVYVVNTGDTKMAFHNLLFSTDASGVEDVVVEKNASSDVYDLLGRKVNEGAQGAGIYIKNGKKFIVR